MNPKEEFAAESEAKKNYSLTLQWVKILVSEDSTMSEKLAEITEETGHKSWLEKATEFYQMLTDHVGLCIEINISRNSEETIENEIKEFEKVKENITSNF